MGTVQWSLWGSNPPTDDFVTGSAILVWSAVTGICQSSLVSCYYCVELSSWITIIIHRLGSLELSIESQMIIMFVMSISPELVLMSPSGSNNWTSQLVLTVIPYLWFESSEPRVNVTWRAMAMVLQVLVVNFKQLSLDEKTFDLKLTS